jgi:translation initiation factor 2 beta subunit (eIF-2beta)/eIF-5
MDDNLSPKQIKQMIKMLSAMLPEDDEPAVDQQSEPQFSNSAIKSKNIDRKSRRVNKFEQMAEFSMHKEDVEFDRKVSKQPPVPRTRTYNSVNVKCRVCGKEESVNPTLIESVDRYKCNKCSSMAG